MNSIFFSVNVDPNYNGENPVYTIDRDWEKTFIAEMVLYITDGMGEEDVQRYRELLSGWNEGDYDELMEVDEKIGEFSETKPNTLIAIYWDNTDEMEAAGTHFYWNGQMQGDVVEVIWPEPKTSLWRHYSVANYPDQDEENKEE